MSKSVKFFLFISCLGLSFVTNVHSADVFIFSDSVHEKYGARTPRQTERDYKTALQCVWNEFVDFKNAVANVRNQP